MNTTKSQAQGIAEVTRSGPPQDLAMGAMIDGVLPRIPRHRMSGYDVTLTARRMRSVLRWLKISSTQYMDWTGDQRPEEFIKDNPSWTARAREVLVLENLETIRR